MILFVGNEISQGRTATMIIDFLISKGNLKHER
ncbi:hypothetical protein EDD80_104202 [Anseongella ginsenosidimutans]|uniref:Uncharacterized protein n=1 Tax=Anseongella ginsenosidimutans TaxID=496056 RepID=A0A4R3KTK7_9SPHI|nr:hypothetical protein EDD80_104202 [Anseongella ginsenosidimutans]